MGRPCGLTFTVAGQFRIPTDISPLLNGPDPTLAGPFRHPRGLPVAFPGATLDGFCSGLLLLRALPFLLRLLGALVEFVGAVL